MKHLFNSRAALFFMPLLCVATAASAWTAPADYPAKALREGRQGTTSFTLLITTSGEISDCIVTESSGHKDLDDATCDMMKRNARFKPAVDAQGAPIEDSYSSKIVWRIPRN